MSKKTADETPAPELDPSADTPDEMGADAELEGLRAENAALKDRMLRVAADAENAKRRAEREANDARAFAIQKFARDLLGVADNLSRAMQHLPRDASDPLVKNLAVGLEMTEKDLLAAFERNGMTKIEPSPGTKFDPHKHQAMMEQTSADVSPGSIVQVFQPGYELFGRVVRAAMVVVAAKDSTGESPAEPVASNPYTAANDPNAGAAVDTKA